MHPNQIEEWKNRLQERAVGELGVETSKSETSKIDVTRMQAKIGKLNRNGMSSAAMVPTPMAISNAMPHC